MTPERVLVITGAGISAESGIPTFRGKTGYWRNLHPAKLATPEAFGRDPELIWEWYHERRARIRLARPNQAHEAITRLSNHIPEFLLVTQNVDNLHARAEADAQRLSAQRIVQVHGDIFLTRCSRCEHAYRELDEDPPGVPECTQCGAPMRPGVVWFGEMLNPTQISRVETFLDGGACDAVLVIGTTATFGYIIDWALRAATDRAQLIEVNPDETVLSRHTTKSFRQPAGEVLPDLVNDLIRADSPTAPTLHH
jgi:NAD-dependent deacetylase